ncbi:MAG: septation protein A [Betaproteobacteria bacterium]|nr:septation protein A [Betaproteobacteria bacterium]
MKFLFDLFPVILFVATYVWTDNIYIATAVIIPASVAQLAYVWFRHRRIDRMLLVSTVLVLILGGLTLFLKDERFIKWKPTALYWIFAAVLALAPVVAKRNLVRLMMEKGFTAPTRIWNYLNVAWVLFFVFMGILNLYIANNFSLHFWVQFKLWGLTGFMLLFIGAQVLVLYRYMEDMDGSGSRK